MTTKAAAIKALKELRVCAFSGFAQSNYEIVLNYILKPPKKKKRKAPQRDFGGK